MISPKKSSVYHTEKRLEAEGRGDRVFAEYEGLDLGTQTR